MFTHKTGNNKSTQNDSLKIMYWILKGTHHLIFMAFWQLLHATWSPMSKVYAFLNKKKKKKEHWEIYSYFDSFPKVSHRGSAFPNVFRLSTLSSKKKKIIKEQKVNYYV